MDKLSIALRQLRQEVEQGLGNGSTVGSVSGSGSVSATLSIVWDREGPEPAWRLDDSPANPQRHSVTIEFQLGTPALSGAEPNPKGTAAPQESSPPGQLVAAADPLVAKCESVFGAPGFDNSARAEVFCELVSLHSLADLQAALEVVRGAGTNEPGAVPPANLVLRLRQLLGFSPAGREAAAGKLRQLFAEFPVTRIQRVLSERWSFGTHWGTANEGFSV